MAFVVLGCLLLVMKYFEFGPVAAWPWWLVLAPFGLAMLWWWYADASGWTKRREMDRMEERKSARRRTAMERLGLKYSSANKADRILIINGQVLHEGDAIAPGLMLEQIRLKAAVLAFKGYRYGIAF